MMEHIRIYIGNIWKHVDFFQVLDGKKRGNICENDGTYRKIWETCERMWKSKMFENMEK